jgi:hypothetical protein
MSTKLVRIIEPSAARRDLDARSLRCVRITAARGRVRQRCSRRTSLRPKHARLAFTHRRAPGDRPNARSDELPLRTARLPLRPHRQPTPVALRRHLDQHRGLDTQRDSRNLHRPLQIAARDFQSFEGVANLRQRHVTLRGNLVELWVQARPTTAATIRAANTELRGVRICG